MNKRIATALLGVTLSCSVFGVVWADNDDNPATEDIPRVVPYDGLLNLDGVGLTGTVDMVFTLYDAASGGNTVWTESWTSANDHPVTVRAGRFSVNLGTYEGIEDVIADAGQVFLGIQVKEPEAENFTALGGRQRLNPVPYALWSAQAADLTVAGSLNVGGTAVVGGELRAAGALRADGATDLNGTLNVDGRTTLAGSLTSTQCSVCLNIRQVDLARRFRVCTRLTSGSFSGWQDYHSVQAHPNQIAISVVCDGSSSRVQANTNDWTADAARDSAENRNQR